MEIRKHRYKSTNYKPKTPSETRYLIDIFPGRAPICCQLGSVSKQRKRTVHTEISFYTQPQFIPNISHVAQRRLPREGRHPELRQELAFTVVICTCPQPIAIKASSAASFNQATLAASFSAVSHEIRRQPGRKMLQITSHHQPQRPWCFCNIHFKISLEHKISLYILIFSHLCFS